MGTITLDERYYATYRVVVVASACGKHSRSGKVQVIGKHTYKRTKALKNKPVVVSYPLPFRR